MRVVDGDVLHQSPLKNAMADQDVVYANVVGQLEQQAKANILLANSHRHQSSSFAYDSG